MNSHFVCWWFLIGSAYSHIAYTCYRPSVNTWNPRQNGCNFADGIFNSFFLSENYSMYSDNGLTQQLINCMMTCDVMLDKNTFYEMNTRNVVCIAIMVKILLIKA